MKKLPLFLFLVSLSLPAFSQVDTLSLLFRDSYGVFELQRGPNGIYRDSKLFDPNAQDYHPSSVANIGMGLIGLCIADAMQWDTAAQDKVIQTLSHISGSMPGFQPDRNAAGMFRHFIDMQTGQRAWDSEYSSIDSGILLAGALFCKQYFDDNAVIAALVDLLWASVDWGTAVADPELGTLYLSFDEQGQGIPGAVTRPFSEYMLVAWLAYQSEADPDGPAHELWNRHYADPDSLLRSHYGGFLTLTDQAGGFQSSFTSQFAYYLCHYFTTSPAYVEAFSQIRKADSAWWADQSVPNNAYWGSGAGSANFGFGYHADAIHNNPTEIISPHIIGGFLPIYPQGADDLLSLFREGNLIYDLPAGGQILWRKSLQNTGWNASEVQGVDYASMLFGLASLPQHLGPDFFAEYNDFDFPLATAIQQTEEGLMGNVSVYPVPFQEQLTVEVAESLSGRFALELANAKGQVVAQAKLRSAWGQRRKALSTAGLPSGTYFLTVYEMQGKQYTPLIIRAVRK